MAHASGGHLPPVLRLGRVFTQPIDVRPESVRAADGVVDFWRSVVLCIRQILVLGGSAESLSLTRVERDGAFFEQFAAARLRLRCHERQSHVSEIA